MSIAEHNSTDPTSAQSALRVLEAFSNASRVTFDRILATRLLGEAERAISGNDSQAWSRRLVEVGESLNPRIRYVECSLKESLAFVRQGIPVAFCDSAAEGRVRWSILQEAKGRRVQLASSDSSVGEIWTPIRKLRGKLGLQASNSRIRWVIGQPALSCQAPDRPTSHRSNDKPDAPLPRLIRLVQPEKKDLWIVLVFSIVVGVLALAAPIAVEALVNTVAFGRYLQPVVILALLLFTFLAFAAALRALITYMVEIIQRRLFIRVVEDLAYRLPRVNLEEFDEKNGPETVNRFFDVITVQKTSAALLLDGISIVLQTIIGMAVLAFYHPYLLGFDVVLLALIAFVIFALGRGSVATAIKESKTKYAIAAWLEELSQTHHGFQGVCGESVCFGASRPTGGELAGRTSGSLPRRNAADTLCTRFASGCGNRTLGLGGWLVILGELTLGQLVAAELIVMIIVGSFAKLGKHMESFYDLLASVDKLGVLFDLSIEPHDKLFHLGTGGPAALSLQSVSYSYGGKPVLKNVSLELPPGESVALVGRAGSGKSTLVDVLCGLRLPASGHVELDGIDLREIRPDSLREHLAVARSVEIFHGTIDENVHLNRSNLQANDVRDALEAVGLLDDILRLPDGLNTVLQTDGAPLTARQSHRLMLARAIIGRPRLLLIDSTLDNLPDSEISELVKRLLGVNVPWTLLVVTGRDEVISSCDRVIALDSNQMEQPEKVIG